MKLFARNAVPAAALGLVAVALLLLRPAFAADFSPDQRKAIEAIIHDYLVKNPEVMLDALEAAKEKLAKDQHDKAGVTLSERRHDILEDPASPVAGNPAGDVTLVEFFDYRCPYCKQVEPSLEALLGEDRQLRFVYKEMPVLGPASVIAARAALAARNQGKYDAFHKAMMNTKGQIDEAAVLKVAGSVGLDIDRLKRDMNAPEVQQAIKANLDLAESLDIRGTPGFVIGEEIVPGAVDLGTLKQLIADARKK
ncbi:MAG TPA: DsbA family protein [Stellaceae bacterium]